MEGSGRYRKSKYRKGYRQRKRKHIFYGKKLDGKKSDSKSIIDDPAPYKNVDNDDTEQYPTPCKDGYTPHFEQYPAPCKYVDTADKEQENEKLGIDAQNLEERIGSIHQSGYMNSSAAEETHLFYEEKPPLNIAETMAAANGKKRRQFSVNEKLLILKEVDRGMKKAEVAKEFGISASTLSTILAQRSNILNASILGRDRKRVRTCVNDEVDRATFNWLMEARAKLIPVSGPILQAQARLEAMKSGIDGFQASNGWLDKFKKRWGLATLRIVGEEAEENSNATVPGLERICRLCLAELSLLDAFTNIYEFHDVHRFNIGDAINDLLGMNMNPEDGYPEKICDSCLLEVAHFRRFKGKCFESKAKLKEMVDEKNLFSGNIKVESDDDLFEAVENEVTDVTVKFEVNEDSGSENDNMLQTVVNSDVLRSEEDLDECGPSREVGATILSDPFQSCLNADEIGIGTPQLSQKKRRLAVRKKYLCYSQPCVTDDSVLDLRDANVNSGLCSDSASPKKSKSTNVSNSVENPGMVSVKLEETSDEELCSDQEVSSNNGYILAS